MMRANPRGYLAVLLFFAASFCVAERHDEEPPRIVSLAPHLTELAFDAGIGALLVGAVEWSDYPAEASDIPRIGDAFRFDLERIVRLRTTHALAWAGGTPADAIAELRQLGIAVEVIEIETLDEIGRAIERLGSLGGNPGIAAARAAEFRRRLAGFDASVEPGMPDIDVFYQVSAKPLFTLAGKHVINEVLALCGARNVFAELDTAAASVDLEAVLARDPLAIVAADPGNGDPAARWRKYPELRAIDCDNVLRVDPALLVTPTPRILDGAQKLCDWIEREVRAPATPSCSD